MRGRAFVVLEIRYSLVVVKAGTPGCLLRVQEDLRNNTKQALV